jgi:hypothetical protein
MIYQIISDLALALDQNGRVSVHGDILKTGK